MSESPTTKVSNTGLELLLVIANVSEGNAQAVYDAALRAAQDDSKEPFAVLANYLCTTSDAELQLSVLSLFNSLLHNAGSDSMWYDVCGLLESHGVGQFLNGLAKPDVSMQKQIAVYKVRAIGSR